MADDWSAVLDSHPIFSVPKYNGSVNSSSSPSAFQLSTSTLPSFLEPDEDAPTLSGRSQIMVLKDTDLILAAGRELRIASLGDARSSRQASYKVMHTPNIQFAIQQLSLNPTGKLLAVAGAFQVGVIVLPRSGFARLVPETIDCKSIQVGQFYHASKSSVPIAKIEWHPWGEAGSTLLVMTIDGKLREYDISLDTEDPQQVLTFMHQHMQGAYLAEHVSEREVSSFTLGKGKADWGPLTVYAITKSGDVYSICPYMPKNASVPSSYIHGLESFIAAKQEFAETSPRATRSHSIQYDYQRKYINALIKQLPSGTVFPAASRQVFIHPPTTIKNRPLRQGPFLLQPSPRVLDGSDGGDATDIVYLSFGDGDEDEVVAAERLGVVLMAFQDGKVDVCLDVEKVEAMWEIKQRPQRDLPMLAVYETIDLGLVSTLVQAHSDTSLLDLLQGNHPVLLPDPIHDDAVFVSHALGVHALHLGSMLHKLGLALKQDTDDGGTALDAALKRVCGTIVYPILNSFSVERQCSNPVLGVAIPNDVYLTYSIFILTSTMQINSFPLNLRPDSPHSRTDELLSTNNGNDLDPFLVPINGPSPYVSLLAAEPFVPPPILSQPLGLPSQPRLALGSKSELMLTPEVMRYLGTTVEQFTTQIHDIQLANRATEARAVIQQHEFSRQQDKCREMMEIIEKLKTRRSALGQFKLRAIQDTQKTILARLDRVLQALMQKASPELSEHEKRWFQELKRMKDELVGAARYDDGSLAARTSLLRREYDRLLPGLKELMEKDNELQKKLAESQQLGVSQAFKFGEKSNLERLKISKMENEVLSLASKLDISLGRPPSH